MHPFAPTAFLGVSLGSGALIGLIAAGWLISAGLMAWRRMAGAAAAGLMGLGVSIYLGLQHSPASGESICNVSAVFDCDTVNRSEYSEIAGIPIAFLGSAFYAAVVAVGILSIIRPDRYRRAGHLLVAGGLASVLYSVFLAWASAQLGAFCLLCISLYGVNLLTLVAGFLAARASGEPLGAGIGAGLAGRDDRSIGAMITAGLVVFIGAMGWYNSIGDGGGVAADPGRAAEDLAPADLRALYEAPGGPLELDGTEPILGSPSAPYTVVEFADFECPHCARVFPELHELVEQNPDVRLMFKHYPISDICNDQVQGARHDKACQAAAASECARQQGRFWEMSSLMFKNQQYLGKEDLRFMAEQAGLDLSAFETCMGDPRTEAAVRTDVAAAGKVGLTGTPTLYLHGVAGDEWVKVRHGPAEAALLIAAHRQGKTIQPPAPAAGR